MIHPVHKVEGFKETLPQFLKKKGYTSLIVLTDINTEKHCYPLLKPSLPDHHLISIPAGEKEKNLNRCQFLWENLLHKLIDRNACMLNLGGGVVGDLGGFIASTYKRGMPYIHIPTTLLSMIDASIGGKNGIDFMGMKNQIGTITQPDAVFLYTPFLKTLDLQNQRSGFAELIKHALIVGGDFWEEIKQLADYKRLTQQQIFTAAQIKIDLVSKDPYERGIRKYLNLGHTLGHAIEGCLLENEGVNPILHGEAVAIGMECMLHLSHLKGYLPFMEYSEILTYLRSTFPHHEIPDSLTEDILDRLKYDKKNIGERLMFTLLEKAGSPLLNKEIKRDEALVALNLYRTKSKLT